MFPIFEEVMGQGSIESDDGRGMVYSNSHQVSVLPRELPDLIQSLLKSASDIQPQQDETREQQQSLGLIRKRSAEQNEKPEAKKRHVDSQGNELDKKEEEKKAPAVVSNNSQKVSKRENKEVIEVKKATTVAPSKQQVDLDDKISDAEFTESLKNLRRRRDVSFASELDTSVSDNDESNTEQDRAVRNDDDLAVQDMNDASVEND
jgi:hypothetical protein